MSNNESNNNVSNAMTDELRTVAKNIRFIRNRLNLSRPIFAGMLGLPPTSLKNYENTYRCVPADLLLAMYRNEKTSPYMPLLMQGKLLSECESDLKWIV